MNQPEKRKVIAARLKLAREWSGLSQGQVAQHLGLHRPSVSEMESGRRRVAAEELSALARLYGVAEAWLLGTQEEHTSAADPRATLAARELAKLTPEDLDRVLGLLTALRRQGNLPES